jgi:hypothetical protein
VYGLGSLAFLRSQGRTLNAGSQSEFIDYLWERVVPVLRYLRKHNFEETHKTWVEELQGLLKTNRKKSLSYGQGQKSLNVFLKFYIDWATLPDTETASRLRPLIHCPLDSVVMRHLKLAFPQAYASRVKSVHRDFSLAAMDQVAYQAWQAWIRDLSPEKPVYVDIAWALERRIT